MNTIGVIILSYAKTEKEYNMTVNTIETLLKSKGDFNFHIVVVETNDNLINESFIRDMLYNNDRVNIIFPLENFNYNKFLLKGYNMLTQLEEPLSHLLILNNDVLIDENAIDLLIKGLNQYDSVSAKCPKYELHKSYTKDIVGYKTSYEICGWNIMFKTSLLDVVSFQDLFPIELEFWFQDNYYAHQLKKHNLKHCLINNALIEHLESQSHNLLDNKERMTIGMQEIYYKLINKN